MQKNWYVIYTKPKSEKKVSSLLSKRGIENFCPLNSKPIKHFRKSKLFYEPLFDRYVFAFIKEADTHQLRNIEYVINLAYWKGTPAIVKNEEITAIKEFISNHQNIKIEKIEVNVNMPGTTEIFDNQSYIIGEKILKIKTLSFKIILPSLGFSLTSEVEIDTARGINVSFENREFQFQS